MKALKDGLKIAAPCSIVRVNNCLEDCYQFDEYELSALYEKLSQFIAYQGCQNYQRIRGLDKSIDFDGVRLVSSYIKVLDRMLCMIRYGVDPLEYGYTGGFLSKIKAQSLQIIGTIDHGYESQEVDNSELQDWLNKNPLCSPLEYWERANYNVPVVIDFSVTRLDSNKKQ